MSVGTTVRGFVALAAATLAGQAIGFVTLSVLARRLGPEGLGSYTFALNLITYFGIPGNFGIVALAVRDVARSPDRTRSVVGEVLALQLVLSAVPYGLMVALAPLLAADADSQRLLPIMGVTLMLEAMSLQWVLFAKQRYVAAAVARLVSTAAFAVLVLAFVAGRDDTVELGWLHVLGGVPMWAIALWAALRAGGRPAVPPDVRHLVQRFRGGVALGFSAVMILIYYSIDSVMLGYLKDTATVGQYAVAYRLPLAILAFASLWGTVLFPHFSALAHRSPDELRSQLSMFSSVSLVASLPLIVGAVIVGPELLPALFGSRYDPAGPPFVLLMAAAALVVFTVNYGTTAVALGDERHYAIAVTAGAATNVAINLGAIPLFGMTGAASATIVAELVVFLYVFVRVRTLLGVEPLDRQRTLRALAATVVMAGALLALSGLLSPVARVGIGVAVFGACALPLRVVHRAELRQLLAR